MSARNAHEVARTFGAILRTARVAAGASASVAERSISAGCSPDRRGIKEVSEKIWLVNFMHYDLGFFDQECGRVERVENPFGARTQEHVVGVTVFELATPTSRTPEDPSENNELGGPE